MICHAASSMNLSASEWANAPCECVVIIQKRKEGMLWRLSYRSGLLSSCSQVKSKICELSTRPALDGGGPVTLNLKPRA